MEVILPELQSNYLTIEENGLNFGLVKEVKLENYISYCPTDVQKAFEDLLSLNMEYSYINGECHNRAELGVQYLKNKGFDIFKIWNFSPALFTTLSRKTLLIQDTLNVQEKIKAVYHVAIGIKEKNEAEDNKIQILDPSFKDCPISIKVWREFQNCDNAMFLFTHYKEYLFNTLNGLRIFHNKNNPTEYVQLPPWFPKIMSGDFFKYAGLAKDQNWIPKGLATSDVGYLIFTDIIQKKFNQSYLSLIQDINLLRNKLETRKMPVKYQEFWQERIHHWIKKIEKIEKTVAKKT